MKDKYGEGPRGGFGGGLGSNRGAVKKWQRPPSTSYRSRIRGKGKPQTVRGKTKKKHKVETRELFSYIA